MEKIVELTGIKNAPKLAQLKKIRIINDDNFYEELKKNLRDFGFNFIGEGAFAITFKGKNSVLKVFANDPAYEAYIDFIKSIPNEYKKFVPKITSVRSYPPNPIIKFVKMPCYNNFYNKYFSKIVFINNFINKLIEKKINIKKIHFNVFSDLQKLSSIEKLYNISDTNDIIDSDDLELINFMFYMAGKIPDNRKYKNDMHPGNFMIDPTNNQLILTDPWGSKKGLSE
jgi:hypothetical protein